MLPEDLQSELRALLRRESTEQPEQGSGGESAPQRPGSKLRTEQIEVDTERCTLHGDGDPVELTRSEACRADNCVDSPSSSPIPGIAHALDRDAGDECTQDAIDPLMRDEGGGNALLSSPVGSPQQRRPIGEEDNVGPDRLKDSSNWAAFDDRAVSTGPRDPAPNDLMDAQRSLLHRAGAGARLDRVHRVTELSPCPGKAVERGLQSAACRGHVVGDLDDDGHVRLPPRPMHGQHGR